MTVQHFKMGAEIPEWLLAMEPINETSVRGERRFGCDVDLIETDAYFLLCPTHILTAVGGILDFTGSYNCAVVATAKPVRIVNGETVPFPRGQQVPGNPPPYGLCIQPWSPRTLSEALDAERPYVVPVADPDPHQTFWQRLRYAFGAR